MAWRELRYVSRERCDIQHSVRVLATYMAKPTHARPWAQSRCLRATWSTPRTWSCTTRRLRCTRPQRWYGGQERRDAKPYVLELFRDSDWASCKVSRRSASSGLLFLNSCLIHSQSLQIPNFCFFEFNGSWDSGSYGLRVCSLKRSMCSRCYSSLWVTLVAWEIKSMWWWDCGWIQQALSLSSRDGVLERRNAFQSYFCGHNKLRENNVSTLTASRPKRTWLTWIQRLCQRRDANSWWNE